MDQNQCFDNFTRNYFSFFAIKKCVMMYVKLRIEINQTPVKSNLIDQQENKRKCNEISLE